MTPTSLVSEMQASSVPSLNETSGGNDHFRDLLNIMMFVFSLFITMLLTLTKSSASLNLSCKRLFSAGKMCSVLSLNVRGLCLAIGSGRREAFRSILTAMDPSSTNLTFTESTFFWIGLGLGTGGHRMPH